MIKMSYDPADIEPFKGKSFLTKNGSCYSIDSDGRILGRPSIEGAKVEYIAGFDVKYFLNFRFALDNKQRLDGVILNIGEEPSPGLCLVISLTPESSRDKRRNGLITSKLKNIEGIV